IQGFYNGSSMVSVNPIVVTVELHDATTYEGMESQIGTLTSSGIGSFTFNSVVDGVPYYIVIKSPNTVETWSTIPVSFISGVLNYDFTTSAAQAYGNNLKLVGSKYCIISGDLNQDGLVDISDMMEIDNDIANHVTGISVSDVNGDGLIDLNDLIIVDNNNINYLSEETPPGTPPEYINYSGQIYHTVLIGTQYWLKENLNVGTMVPGSQSQSNNGIIEKYCYNNLLANCNIYGGLYQWNETMQYSSSVGKVQGICPVGWHIPSINEFSTLATSVSGNSNSLKSVGQGVDIGAGTNSSGFSVLMTGSRYYPTGTFSDLGGESYFWSSSISGLTNASYMDISGYIPDIYQYTVNQDYGFSIRCVKDGWFLLLAPNGGESWQVGSTQNITWTSSNIANAKIELSTDNGNNWSTIIGSTPASIHSYSWTIPNSPSSLCKIKLSDASDSTVKSISTTPFTIWTPTITLSSPNGGEIWKVGDIDTIKWTSTNVANVRIDYSTDTGTNWTTLIASTNSSIGYFAWTVPFTPSVNCKIRIVDLVDTTINAVSINNFTISNPPCPGLATVVYGSQTYNTVLIGNQCWLKENLNIGSFLNSLQEQTNNAVIEKYCYNNNPANCTTYGGLYEWAEAVQYQNGATNLASPNPAFYGHIQGICPSGWHIPDTSDYNVLSNTVHNDANSLKAVGQGAFSGAGTNLSGFSALLAGTRFSDGSFASLTLYTFLLTPNEANNVNIYYADLGTDFDTVFVGSNSKQYGRSIRCIKDGSVSLQSPNGGENWQAGSNHNITWTSTYFTNVKIDFSTDNGSTWSTVIASTPSSAGSYNWTIPNSPSTLCKVRVSDAIDTTIMSIITSVFTISPAPAITISSPIGGEVWNVTEVHSITWTSTSVLTVKIDYTTDEGSTWIPVFSVPASSGSYDWTVPNTPGQCKVRISDEGNSILNSISTNDFTIANP
ncbi:MAG: FISUMP domain-containing protein, partial [Ignavibacteriaceae bacterium]|nr:FISUMP domain-containing protein [Ignavibacteriaceae bacterium]